MTMKTGHINLSINKCDFLLSLFTIILMFSNTALVKQVHKKGKKCNQFQESVLQKREESPSYHEYPVDTDGLSASECVNLLLPSWGTILEQRQSANHNMAIVRKLFSYLKCTVPLYTFFY